jgi:hypothetical protein
VPAGSSTVSSTSATSDRQDAVGEAHFAGHGGVGPGRLTLVVGLSSFHQPHELGAAARFPDPFADLALFCAAGRKF